MVIEITEKDALLDFLSKDRGLSVYFIGDLSERYFKNCRWFAYMENDKITSLILLYNHPNYPTILSLGEVKGMNEIIIEKINSWPEKFHSHIFPEHIPAFEKNLKLTGKSEFLRMILKRENLKPYFTGNDYKKDIIKLSRKDGNEIFNLLEDYPENFFSLEDLESEFYFGIYENNSLVSMAGVHVVSSEFKVAALGNIVTKKHFRRKNYSKLCTGYLLNELFKIVDIIALNVSSDNYPAIKMYEKFGFHCYSKLYLSFCESL